MDKENFSFHSLRHTYATYLLSHNIPIKFVQEQLGHSTPMTTLNIYNHVMSNVNVKAMDMLKLIECEQNMSIGDKEKIKAL